MTKTIGTLEELNLKEGTKVKLVGLSNGFGKAAS